VTVGIAGAAGLQEANRLILTRITGIILFENMLSSLNFERTGPTYGLVRSSLFRTYPKIQEQVAF
jgi:hypothetical protein